VTTNANALEQYDAVAEKQRCNGHGGSSHEGKEKGGAKYIRRNVTALYNDASHSDPVFRSQHKLSLAFSPDIDSRSR
jgi:hypothetical protein